MPNDNETTCVNTKSHIFSPYVCLALKIVYIYICIHISVHDFYVVAKLKPNVKRDSCECRRCRGCLRHRLRWYLNVSVTINLYRYMYIDTCNVCPSGMLLQSISERLDRPINEMCNVLIIIFKVRVARIYRKLGSWVNKTYVQWVPGTEMVPRTPGSSAQPVFTGETSRGVRRQHCLRPRLKNILIWSGWLFVLCHSCM